MALANDANQNVDPPSPEAEGYGPVPSTENNSRNLRLAANNPNFENTNKESAKTRAGLSDFLAKRQAAALEVLAEFADQSTLTTALMAVANDIQHRFQCERVAVGLVTNEQIELAAISQQAVIDLRTTEVRLLRDAMQETCDQQSTIQFPDEHSDHRMMDAHQALSLEHERAHIHSIPLCDREIVIGALLLQRRSDQTWSPLTLELLTQIAQLIAPLIAYRRDAERGILDMIRVRTRNRLARLATPNHLMAKAGTVLLFLLVAFTSYLPVTHVVKASAELMSTERRVISAPNNGLISSVFVNAGDQVLAGDILLELETRDLELQRSSQENELNSARAELRSAMASYERKEVAIAQARVAQIDAELALTDQLISRSTVKAPVDGVIISGDMSQTLGMSVERGKVLMEMSPSDGYEVQLLIHEVDMPYIQLGQTGRLSLASDPGQELPVEISAIHPIAIASGGASKFLVETVLVQQSNDLRPGQTGVVKLDVGEATLLWTWTHRFLEWSRQRLWEWFG